ncbi:MAG: DEAD/DEAH box helicase [Microbacteriaceae bacterium]
MTDQLDSFRRGLSFDLDPFQTHACQRLEAGRSVLVAAPTGAGKTVVAEFAIHLAMQEPVSKVFYTTPMKALSNQKFHDLVAEYGPDDVGLLTGDSNVNSRARIVVMTTEVLRNMLYAQSPLLKNLAFVVMDEVHYLADRFRGAVWEEVIIHLPEPVRLISLSATVSNAEEFGDWLHAVRGDTDVIVSEQRPVPLEQHVLIRGKLIDLFDSPGAASEHRVNPELVRMAPSGRSVAGGTGRNRSRHQPRQRPGADRMDRASMVRLLNDRNLLPAIFFIFSRAGCDEAVRQVLRAGVRLTRRTDREEIRRIVDAHCRTLKDEDLAVLGYWQWLDGLERGVAAHHAGMLPAFKEVVEELFRLKLVTAVFATETLALGINMPARTVVLEKLEKFNGEARVPVTPGEYTQLTGRAGRRGIDVEGHSVIQWQDGLDPEAVAALASKRTYPLNSSFSPTYNMAVNLIDRFGRQRTREVLELSFAQFQADRAVVDLARKVRAQRESLAGFAEAMQCDRGDFSEYAGLRRQITDLERSGGRGPEQQSHSRRERRKQELAALHKRLHAHPCHSCPDREQHARWAQRWWKLARQTEGLEGQIHSRTGAVARVFDRVTEVLLARGYLIAEGDGTVLLTPSGRALKRIYGERDLLVAECLRTGAWNDLDAASVAAIACALVYEPRRDENDSEYAVPRGAFRSALARTRELWQELDDVERDSGLPGSEPISAGLCQAMHRWGSGGALDWVLDEADMAAGDFVRWTKQTIDLLDQVSLVADGPLGRTARRALEAIRRGIVAFSSVE